MPELRDDYPSNEQQVLIALTSLDIDGTSPATLAQIQERLKQASE